MAVGDVDEDGAPDFALARRGHGPSGFQETRPDEGGPGVVWILSGRGGGVLRRIDSPRPDPDFGSQLVSMGDVDGDGHVDLAIAGDERIWIVSARDGRVLRAISNWRLWRVARSRFATHLASGADFDGDGVQDLLTDGATYGEGNEYALVLSGRTGQLLRAYGTEAATGEGVDRSVLQRVPGVVLHGAVGWIHDRDGDGRPEVGVVVNDGDWEDPEYTLLVLSSVDGLVLARSPLPDNTDVPWLVCSLGDIDGDGYDEVLLSVVNEYVFVYSGATGEELRRHSYVAHYLQGEGTSLEALDDLDGDGVSDYLVAANEDGFDCDPGSVLVYSGESGKELRALHLEYFDGSCGAGVDACAIGDVDGDGVTELALHLPRLREARVLSGASFEVLTSIDLTAVETGDER